jgi:hypothetical protein
VVERKEQWGRETRRDEILSSCCLSLVSLLDLT